jgi:hypothetical protein
LFPTEVGGEEEEEGDGTTAEYLLRGGIFFLGKSDNPIVLIYKVFVMKIIV